METVPSRATVETRLAEVIAAGGIGDVGARVAAALGVHLAATELPDGAGPDALFDRAAAIVAEHGGLMTRATAGRAEVH